MATARISIGTVRVREAEETGRGVLVMVVVMFITCLSSVPSLLIIPLFPDRAAGAAPVSAQLLLEFAR
jgi:hypothetical protein